MDTEALPKPAHEFTWETLKADLPEAGALAWLGFEREGGAFVVTHVWMHFDVAAKKFRPVLRRPRCPSAGRGSVALAPGY
jgi:hypothetical protein